MSETIEDSIIYDCIKCDGQCALWHHSLIDDALCLKLSFLILLCTELELFIGQNDDVFLNLPT